VRSFIEIPEEFSSPVTLVVLTRFLTKMPFTIMYRKAFAMLLYKASRLLRNFIFAGYGLPAPVEQENVPFTFFPTRQYSRSRISRK